MFGDLATAVFINGVEQLLHFLCTESLGLFPGDGFLHEISPAVIIHLAGDDILTDTVETLGNKEIILQRTPPSQHSGLRPCRGS